MALANKIQEKNIAFQTRGARDMVRGPGARRELMLIASFARNYQVLK